MDNSVNYCFTSGYARHVRDFSRTMERFSPFCGDIARKFPQATITSQGSKTTYRVIHREVVPPQVVKLQHRHLFWASYETLGSTRAHGARGDAGRSIWCQTDRTPAPTPVRRWARNQAPTPSGVGPETKLQHRQVLGQKPSSNTVRCWARNTEHSRAQHGNAQTHSSSSSSSTDTADGSGMKSGSTR